MRFADNRTKNLDNSLNKVKKNIMIPKFNFIGVDNLKYYKQLIPAVKRKKLH